MKLFYVFCEFVDILFICSFLAVFVVVLFVCQPDKNCLGREIPKEQMFLLYLPQGKPMRHFIG